MSDFIKYLIKLLLEYIESNSELRERLRLGQYLKLHFFFARVAVPSLVTGLGVASYLGIGPFLKLEDKLGLFQVKSRIASNQVNSEEGTLVLVNTAVGMGEISVGIPWQSSYTDEIWSTLESDVLKGNASRIQSTHSGLEISLPLKGTQRPFILGSRAQVSGNLVFPDGQKLPTDRFLVRSSRLSSLALMATIAAAFCLGFTLNFGMTPNYRREHNRGEEAADKDKD